MKRIIPILFLFLGGIATEVMAQQMLFKSYGRADGLPSDYVFTIYQDSKGYMWFGTERGAARYDGRGFIHLNKENGLPDNFIYAIFEDSDGCLWIGTHSGKAACYRNGQLNLFQFDEAHVQPLSSIIEDHYGRVYFKFSHGVGVFHNGMKKFFHLPDLTNKESQMTALPDGRIFLSSINTMYLINPTNNLELELSPLTCTNCPSAIYPGRYPNFLVTEGGYYLATFNDLYKVSIDGDRFTIQESVQIPGIMYLEAIESDNGTRLILGTRSNGRFTYKDGSLRQIITSENSRSQMTTAMLVDYENNLWTGFFGEGVEKIPDWAPLVYDQRSGLQDNAVWRFVQWNSSIYTSSLSGIHAIRENEVHWLNLPGIGSVRGIQFSDKYMYFADIFNLYRIPISNLMQGDFSWERIMEVSEGINDLLIDTNGILWVATAINKVFRFDEQSLEHHYFLPEIDGISSVEELAKSDYGVWLLTFQEGALRYDHAFSLRHFEVRDGLPSNNVLSVYEDSLRIYFATDKGMAIYDKARPLGMELVAGLEDEAIHGIFPARNHHPENPHLWVVTGKHLYEFENGGVSNPRSMAFMKPRYASINRMQLAGTGDALLIATNNGLIRYDLHDHQHVRVSPRVNLESIAFNGNSVLPGEAANYRIRSSSVTLDFSFSGLSFIDEAAIMYRHKLSGIEGDWSPPQAASTVRYVNVPDGRYTFQVKAINADGTESEHIASLAFLIGTPVWKTAWFRLLVFVFLMIGMVMLINMRIAAINRRMIARNEQKQFEAVQRITASIAHDIKNSVFSLNFLSKNLEKRFENETFRRDAIDTLENTTTHLNKLMLKLQESKHSFEISPTEPDINLTIQKTVARCAMNVRKGINIKYGPCPEITWMHDPSAIGRILENLINNAVDAIEGDGNVSVRLLRPGKDIIRIEVEDDGAGISEEYLREKLFKPFQTTKSRGLGLGLFTVFELVKAHKGKITAHRLQGKGTLFTLDFEGK